ncbi:PTS ascorbate transporter subunit IIC [Atopobium sp. oral taxon 810]|uniref:PTS ascorbate transporter subunit IIC n=1 Tax=Atopobium sp. oral taxon 810 TaxID=712158 RepID=UPI0003963CE9|nr:PTS ascorbate transporter subunit IIC [Atopobium sp. oral taxon 810]ERI05327.1 putative sugar-specific permease, SgaT/UlaA [Atopobium sp. oral taxon 810 str. F0209]
MAVLDFIVNILSTPAILVGLLALVGLCLQHKPIEDVVKGTIKTIVGFLVLSAGASFLQTGSLLAFGELFNYAFNMQGVVPNNEAVVADALQNFGTSSAIIMALGMALNIVLARFSRMPYIFLTGHHTLYMACMIAVILGGAGHLEGVSLYIAGGCLLGLIMVLSPAYCQVTFRKVTGTDGVALGHFGGIGYWFAGVIGKLFANDPKRKSTEEINFPKRLVFLRDTTVSISITMMVFFLIVVGVAVAKGLLNIVPAGTDAAAAAELLAPYGLTVGNLGALLNIGTETKTNWIVWALTSGMSFAGGVYIILSGVRLIIGEIVPAFKGIADKLVPGAKPALDCPVAFTYAPNAVIIGFLSSFIGGIVGLLILNGINTAIPVALILPGVVPHFFCGATAGVFGNAEGGLKGCIAGSFAHGLLITFLPMICMPVFSALGYVGTTFSDADFSWMGIVFGNTVNFAQGGLLVAICVIVYLLPIIYNFVAPKKQA